MLRYLSIAFEELLREKEALLSSANEERRHLAEWREKATRLDQLVIKQNAELIRYAEIEKRYTDILKELDEERAKVYPLLYFLFGRVV